MAAKNSTTKTTKSTKATKAKAPATQPKGPVSTPKAIAEGKHVGAKSKATTTSKPEATKPKVKGIGAFVREQLGKGKDTGFILAQVGAKFVGAKTSRASVAWYRTQMKEEGLL